MRLISWPLRTSVISFFEIAYPSLKYDQDLNNRSKLINSQTILWFVTVIQHCTKWHFAGFCRLRLLQHLLPSDGDLEWKQTFILFGNLDSYYRGVPLPSHQLSYFLIKLQDRLPPLLLDVSCSFRNLRFKNPWSCHQLNEWKNCHSLEATWFSMNLNIPVDILWSYFSQHKTHGIASLK